MAYVPEPTHQVNVDTQTGTDKNLTAQLEREFRALQNSLEQISDFIRGALPWKGFNIIIEGVGGTPDGLPNPTLPIIIDSYNIDLTAGAGGTGIERTAEGVYLFTLLVPNIGGIDILAVLYPSITHIINVQPNGNTLIDVDYTRVRLTNADVLTGTFELTCEQAQVGASGRITWVPYDLRSTITGGTDKVWGTGTLNVAGRAASYGNSP